MTTLHEVGARDALQGFLAKPNGGAAIADTMTGLRTGRWPAWYIEVIGQDGRNTTPSRWTMEQVFAFMLVDNFIQLGAVSVVDIHVGTEPEADSHRAQNQQALRNLNEPFVAVVDQAQYGADSDGRLEWHSPIGVSVRGDDQQAPWVDGVVRKLGDAPLEIGTTDATRTAVHLGENRAVARWPYGHDTIRLLLCTATFPVFVGDGSAARPFVPAATVPDSGLPSMDAVRKRLEQERGPAGTSGRPATRA